MTPKIIHYCWFGKKPKPELVNKCIKSWKKYCPDYEIKEWNEHNFDIGICKFTSNAYKAKKYAFVSDYVRLFALYTIGGVYLDTDVEVVKSFSNLLEETCFIGCEENDRIGTCVIGAKPKSLFIKNCLSYYNNIDFNINNLKPNTLIISEILKKYQNNIFCNLPRKIDNYVTIYPIDYFTAKSGETGVITKTQNTYTIHHFSGSWLPWYERKERLFCHKFGLKERNILSRVVDKYKKYIMLKK